MFFYMFATGAMITTNCLVGKSMGEGNVEKAKFYAKLDTYTILIMGTI